MLGYRAPSRSGEKVPELSRGMSNPATHKHALISYWFCKFLFVGLCALDSWLKNCIKNKGPKFLPKMVRRRNKQQITKSRTR